MLHPVILCGGAGTRLWPLSEPQNPKQFLPLVSENSLLQDTMERLQRLPVPVAPPLVVCNQEHGARVQAEADAIGVKLQGILLEPVGRNTAPAVAVAAMHIAADTDGDGIMFVLPADHAIRDHAAFGVAVEDAYRAASAGGLVTCGVVPDRPETGYGYIRRGGDAGPGYAKVEQFVEKPNRDAAERYLESGNYLWNSGMFLFRASVYLRELNNFARDISEACEQAFSSARRSEGMTTLNLEAFTACRSESIDYAVMEHTNEAFVVSLDAGWSDVGSWSSLLNLLPRDRSENVLRGKVVSKDSKGCYVHASERLVAVLGVEDIVVVETGSAVFVAHKDRSEDVKQLVETLSCEHKESVGG